ncbi:hypothetical protein Tco_1061554 [Tanacetum coccineum]
MRNNGAKFIIKEPRVVKLEWDGAEVGMMGFDNNGTEIRKIAWKGSKLSVRPHGQKVLSDLNVINLAQLSSILVHSSELPATHWKINKITIVYEISSILVHSSGLPATH